MIGLALGLALSVGDVIPPLPDPYTADIPSACSYFAQSCEDPPLVGGLGKTLESAAVKLELTPGTQVSNGVSLGYTVTTDELYAKSGQISLSFVCVNDDTSAVTSVQSTSGLITWTQPIDILIGYVTLSATGQCGVGEHRELFAGGTFSDQTGAAAFDPSLYVSGWVGGVNTLTIGEMTFTIDVTETVPYGSTAPVTFTVSHDQSDMTGPFTPSALQDLLFERLANNASVSGRLGCIGNGTAVGVSARTAGTWMNAPDYDFAYDSVTVRAACSPGAALVDLTDDATGDNIRYDFPGSPAEDTSSAPNRFSLASLTKWEVIEGIRYRDTIPGANLQAVDGMLTSFDEALTRCSTWDLKCIFVPQVNFIEFMQAAQEDVADMPVWNDTQVIFNNMVNVAYQGTRYGACGVLFEGLTISGVGSGLGALDTCDWPAGPTGLARSLIGFLLVVGASFATTGIIFWMFDIPEPRWLRVGGVSDKYELG
jgi:hypothetical protein